MFIIISVKTLSSIEKWWVKSQGIEIPTYYRSLQEVESWKGIEINSVTKVPGIHADCER